MNRPLPWTVVAIIAGHALFSAKTYPQGCMPARAAGFAPGLRLMPYLEENQWEAAITYRYLSSEKGYIGDQRWPNSDEIVARTSIHTIELQTTYSITPRYNVSLAVPFVYGDRSSVLDHDGTRHTTSAGGLGDVRLIGNVWLFDPVESKNGNISIGAGVKAPTGDDTATDTFYKPGGPQVRPVDSAIQPGDGGWGINLEIAAYQKIIEKLYGYVAGAYLINPREVNESFTTAPYPPGPAGAVRNNSVPDQYLGRAGLSYEVWSEQSLAISLGGRIDGVPSRDLVGGSEGFRRPGYSVSIEPGVSWNHGPNALSIFTPVMVYANKTKNIYDDRFGVHGPAAFADFVIIASYARKF